MKKNNVLVKCLFSSLLTLCLFSVAFSATTKNWRNIINQLRDDWRPDEEIRQAITDIWYNAEEYLWRNTNSRLRVIVADNYDYNYNLNYWNDSTSELINDIVSNLRDEWWTEREIEEVLKNLWINNNTTFTSQENFRESYTARNCKSYTIIYDPSVNAYTSPDFKKTAYFINADYLKRYIDSRNQKPANCSIGMQRIMSPYNDMSWDTWRYIAPNGKIYFISYYNGMYMSDDISSSRTFRSLSDIKSYIKNNNSIVNF